MRRRRTVAGGELTLRVRANLGWEPSGDDSQLDELLERYRDRPLKIGAFTACSNVTGVDWLDRTVKKCLAKEPDHRWQSAADSAVSAPRFRAAGLFP